MTEKRTVYFIMLDHPTQGQIRVGPSYATRECAKSWVHFVQAANRGMGRVSVVRFSFRLVDRKMSAKDLEILSRKFNMDPPGEQP